MKDKTSENEIESLSTDINQQVSKVENMKELKKVLLIISDYAEVHIYNPKDGYEITVTIKSDEITNDIIWVSELDKYFKDSSITTNDIMYKPKEEKFKLHRTFKTAR